MPSPDQRLWQELTQIRESLVTIEKNVSDIKVELGRHHERFKWSHEQIKTLNAKTAKAQNGLDNVKREVRDFRIWLLSATVAALLSLVGVMMGIMKWLFEKV